MTFRWLGKSEEGNTITLNKLHNGMFTFPEYFTSDWAASNTDLLREGAAIDVETTGLDHSVAKVIEVGLRTFKFNRLTGEILSLESSYSGLQDPGEPLSAEITKITGITDEMLTGQKIDWQEVNAILSRCQVIIAQCFF